MESQALPDEQSESSDIQSSLAAPKRYGTAVVNQK